MIVQIKVTATVERVSGPFPSRDAIEDALCEELESVDPGQLDVESAMGAAIECETTDWEVEVLT